jgi:hypothetical protein
LTPPIIQFLSSHLKHKVSWKSVNVPPDRSFELLVLNAIQFGQVTVYHYLLATNYKYFAGNVFNWNTICHAFSVEPESKTANPEKVAGRGETILN